jgi:hypothetical protein
MTKPRRALPVCSRNRWFLEVDLDDPGTLAGGRSPAVTLEAPLLVRPRSGVGRRQCVAEEHEQQDRQADLKPINRSGRCANSAASSPRTTMT